MNKWIYIPILALVTAGCATRMPFGAVGGDNLVVEQLVKRRAAMSPMEADVRFRFPSDAFVANSLEGHAAYSLESGVGRLRVVTGGPIGVTMDLLIDRGEFSLRLPGFSKVLKQVDIYEIYGHNTLARVPSILARRPGLFFGGIPDDIGEAGLIKRFGGGRWLVSKDDKRVKYLLDDKEPIIRRAIVQDGGIGSVAIDLEDWENAPQGQFPTTIRARYRGRELFELRISNWSFGGSLPEGIFKM